MGEKDFSLEFSGLKELKRAGTVRGKFSLAVNGEKIVFRPHENKKDFFYFDFPQTIFSVNAVLKKLQKKENLELPIVIDFSGDDDSHSIKIKVKHFNSNLLLEIFETFEGKSSNLFGPVMVLKPEFSKKLKSFLSELKNALKETKLFEKVEKEVKKQKTG